MRGTDRTNQQRGTFDLYLCVDYFINFIGVVLIGWFSTKPLQGWLAETVHPFFAVHFLTLPPSCAATVRVHVMSTFSQLKGKVNKGPLKHEKSLFQECEKCCGGAVTGVDGP